MNTAKSQTDFVKDCDFLVIGMVDHTGIAKLHDIGIPLPKGLCNSANTIGLYLNGEQIECELLSTALWPDNSIKWVNARVLFAKSGELTCKLSDQPHNTFLKCQRKRVNTKPHELYADEQSDFSLSVEAATKSYPSISTIKEVYYRSQERHLSFTSKFEFDCWVGNDKFTLYGTVIRPKDMLVSTVKIRIHNPNAAAHSGGTWDLGDSNSIYFKYIKLHLLFDYKDSSIRLRDADENTKIHYETTRGKISLNQFSSGGENWQSPAHWDENRQSTVFKHGFELIDEHNHIYQSGLRAEPVVSFLSENLRLQIRPIHFWQNFPASIDINDQGCVFSLFPQLTELQGGESKTWQFEILPSSIENCADDQEMWQESQCFLHYSHDFLNRCKVFPFLYFDNQSLLLSPIIEGGITGERSFFEKREMIDEYGWRNFGELYADHEVGSSNTQGTFISHYNNQYDPVFGLQLQFLLTGKDDYLTLCETLSQHVQDIDIYDTDKDRSEYNGGLMWHTDHYLSAETCTHRSNSKYHSSAYEGFLGSGGPGGQHCYTTGLLFRYKLFIDEGARDKVLALTKWVRCFYNGNDSLLDRTFRFLTIDLKRNAYTNIGKKFEGFKYALDRGTANYVVALLDSYEITQQQQLIDEAAFVIKNTVHPSEDLTLRTLENIEECWFYTVFLQAVVRFLFTKEGAEQVDLDYWYARQTLLHYGKWIYENEQFYLHNAESLEFPNDTWCAQEVRKANLLYFSYYFGDAPDKNYLIKADEFYVYISEKLLASEERFFTRILALLMQNDGVFQRFDSWRELEKSDENSLVSPIPFESQKWGPPPQFSAKTITKQYLKDCLQIAKRFSVHAEIKWVKTRLKWQ